MRSFTDRVNATLPIEKPDYVLLTLLQAHNGRTCGECPAGEVAAGGGRCVPQAIVAQTHRKDEPKVAAAHAGSAAVESGQRRRAQPATARLFTPVPTSVVSSEPLPGRMAIGGPRSFRRVDPASQGAVVPGTAPAAARRSDSGADPPGGAAAGRRGSGRCRRSAQAYKTVFAPRRPRARRATI